MPIWLIFQNRLATIPSMTDHIIQQTCFDKALRSYGLAGVGESGPKKSRRGTMQVARTVNRHRWNR
jgi:hypothetical protein